MGGDNAPFNEILGAIDALKACKDLEIILVGVKDIIERELNNHQFASERLSIVHADEVIDMHDVPVNAVRTKLNSSLVIGANLIRDKKAEALVSAGNTGAVLAASTLIIGRIPGCGRPTIGASFPTSKSKVCQVFDVGASVDSKPNHLLEYAIMGSVFAKEMYGIDNPSIGLLSVGEEETKGNELTFAAHKLLKESGLNFIGNVEGRDVLNGKVDIIVCDGFVGNIILKFGESFLHFLKARLKSVAEKSLINKIKIGLVKGLIKEALSDVDYQTHGGVPLLGIKGVSIIGHGSSSPLAIRNMILRAKEMLDKELITKFKESFERYGK
jgi:glycerol-3-phosphate acyltransferase PlsX